MAILDDPVDPQVDFRNCFSNHKEIFVIQTEFADANQILVVHNVPVTPYIDSGFNFQSFR